MVIAEAATKSDSFLSAEVASDSQEVLDTDVGVFPSDWELKALGEIGQPLAGLTYAPSDVSSEGTLVLRSSNVQNGKLAFENNVHVRMDIPDRAIVKEGDILICVRNGSRELIGKCALINQYAEGMAFGAFMGVFRSDINEFVFYAFQSGYVQRQIREHLGATINQITAKSLKSFKIALPKDPAEISSIAGALAEADQYVSELEILIQKKRLIKQGAMQELLSGRRRLPGFCGDVATRKFGDIAVLRKRRINPATSGRQPFCIELENVSQGTGRLLGWSEAQENASLKAEFEAGDVLFGKLRAYLRKFWLADRQGVCSTEFWVLGPAEDLATSSYLYQIVQTDHFIDVASQGYGTHMPRSDWTSVSEIELPIPTLDEQAAIGTVLGEMDAEIDALEIRLEKARQTKQGMMQELLTGRVRLV